MPAQSTDYDLVIFDCDGVLIDSELISARMLIEVLTEHGVKIDLPYIARHFLGRSYPVVLAQIRAEFGIVLPDHFEDRYRARLLAAFEKDLVVMPGATAVVEQLNVVSCVATSSSPGRVQRSMQIVGLGAHFSDRVFTSTQVENGKPAPDLFLFAANEMGANPGRCLVIEDSLNGIRAAKSAGMDVCRFIGGSHLGAQAEIEPADARPLCRIACFSKFFREYPALKKPAVSVA